jgi:hypothetical protein
MGFNHQMERSLALFALCQQQRRAKQPIQHRDKGQAWQFQNNQVRPRGLLDVVSFSGGPANHPNGTPALVSA